MNEENQPITERNEFFDPAQFQDGEYCVVGFYESYTAEDAGSGYGYRLLGTRSFRTLPTRPLGSPGRILIEITENMDLMKGHKPAKIRASKQRPIKAWAMIEAIYSRMTPTKKGTV